ncbi:hypothetical protein FGO68_gene6929 [Halteria grandinella]|uniref:TLDc domain-containing protein n=1 Tax=Halteria grandinella TaxID=5974 RepID=A0A8J8T635_HALGN|nr:hypothetical protein FGO68_gene6929 [Halteria grandinella]
MLPVKLRLRIEEMKRNLVSQAYVIYCDSHPDREASYFSESSNELVCDRCLSHSSIYSESKVQEFRNSEFDSYCERALTLLDKVLSQFQELKDNIKSLQAKQKESSASNFIEIVSQCKKLLSPNLQTSVDKDQLNLLTSQNSYNFGSSLYFKDRLITKSINGMKPNLFDIKRNYSTSRYPQEGPGGFSKTNLIIAENAEKPYDPINSYFTSRNEENISKLRQSLEQLKRTSLPSVLPSLSNRLFVNREGSLMTANYFQSMLQDWISNMYRKSSSQNLGVEFKLIYKGLRDGFSSLNFHLKCDDISPTVTLIKSGGFNQIFGAYTSQPWSSQNFRWVRDEKAFLFSLSQGARYLQDGSKTKDEMNLGKSVFHHKDYLVAFGAGHDLYIASNCNSNRNSYCNISTTYMQDQNTQESLGQLKQLAGSYNFYVEEIETYQVIFNEQIGPRAY